ncbi:MAG: hypothetical protein KDI09_06335, partial [Halioglobus sp.]|nr:hypothetical protein [Halioglobus sp.]
PIFDNQVNEYRNNAGVSMRVQSVLLPSGCTPVPSAMTCTNGLQIPQTNACRIDCLGANASDVRLKTDITVVGRADNGLPLYHFRYIGGQTLYEGVMAQDVLDYMPAAVVPMEDGFLAVNYQMLGLRMQVVQ